MTVEATASQALDAGESAGDSSHNDGSADQAQDESSPMEAGTPSEDDGYDLEIRARAERAIAASGTHVTVRRRHGRAGIRG